MLSNFENIVHTAGNWKGPDLNSSLRGPNPETGRLSPDPKGGQLDTRVGWVGATKRIGLIIT